MNGIIAGYTANTGMSWQRIKYVAGVDETPNDKKGRPPRPVQWRGDTVTISDEARAMSAAAAQWPDAAGKTGTLPAVAEKRDMASWSPGGPEAGASSKGRRAGAEMKTWGAGAEGARGAEPPGDNAKEIADLEERIRKVREEITDLMLKPDTQENKHHLMSKQLELVTLQSQLARLESQAAVVA